MMRRMLHTAGMSLSALFGNRARSALTTLGIVIGVAAVIVITAIGNGVQGQVSGQLGDLGPNLITISPGSGGVQENVGPGNGPPPGAPGGGATANSTLTTEDAEALAQLPSVEAASPTVSVTLPVESASYAFTGVAPTYREVSSIELRDGRFVERAGELVLTAEAARELLGTNHENAVGETVAVRGEEFEIVGVSEATEAAFGAMNSSSYMFVDDALALSGTTNVGQISALASDPDAVPGTADEVATTLTERHGAEDFSVTTQEQLLSTFTRITDLLTYALAGIASISLLVGGIGIMNIMLVSVAERTREIGVRKALGASDTDILVQFLLEAVMLAVLGGVVGISVGVGASAVLPILLPELATEVTWTAIGLASGFSALIGVVFGVLPALRSARLQPVEALRRE